MSGKKTFVHRVATVAAVGIEPSALEELKSAWLMFGIEVRLVPYEGLRTLKDQTINAFVVRLGSGAKSVLQAIRSMDKYQHTLIYGVGEDADIVGMAEFEISVLMPDLKEDSVIEAIQNTYQLLLNQM